MCTHDALHRASKHKPEVVRAGARRQRRTPSTAAAVEWIQHLRHASYTALARQHVAIAGKDVGGADTRAAVVALGANLDGQGVNEGGAAAGLHLHERCVSLTRNGRGRILEQQAGQALDACVCDSRCGTERPSLPTGEDVHCRANGCRQVLSSTYPLNTSRPLHARPGARIPPATTMKWRGGGGWRGGREVQEW